MRVVTPIELMLIARQWCQRWGRRTIPTIPATAVIFPVASPVVPPARRRVHHPTREIYRRLAIVAHGNAQNIQRDIIWTHKIPRTVIPTARIPPIPGIHPVLPIVKELIAIQGWSVIHRQSVNRLHIRISGHIDTNFTAGNINTDADIRLNCSDRTEQHKTGNIELTHYFYSKI